MIHLDLKTDEAIDLESLLDACLMDDALWAYWGTAHEIREQLRKARP